ncbi:MAG: hypothetical protein ACTSQQ_03290 [Candidatus Helarchaeota archaeon]
MSMVKCPLCGKKFDALEHSGGCEKCSLFKSCELLRCANCGYEFPVPDKKLLKFVKEMRGDKDKCEEGVCK